MKTLFLITLLALLSIGCGTARVRQAPPPPVPVPHDQIALSDPRSPAQLQGENIQLHQRLARLEQDHRSWRANIDQQEQQIKALKDQKNRAEDERDRYKKQLEKLRDLDD